MEYNFRAIEDKWQQYWREHKTYKVETDKSKPKYYVLDMFPYPSGAGLHVGHPLGYIASDIFARYKRLRGFNVLHPMGYDSFGLPAEQYAIQTGQHPAITTEQNIARYREQLDLMGFSFDWDREVRTSDPKFYKWTQWIFIQLFHSWYNNKTNKAEKLETLIAEFEKNGNRNINAACSPLSLGEGRGEVFSADEWKNFSEKEQQEILMNYRLAFLSETMVNWCPALGSVLANDEVKDGVSERGGYPVERKLMQQWSLRITAYSQRLLDDLETIDWSESLKESQRNWIGRSEGTSLSFRLTPSPSPLERGAQLHVPQTDAPYENDTDSAKHIMPHYLTADTEHWEVKKRIARENRKNPTEAENILWQRLRNNQLGFKIRRQHPIEIFIADFVCIDRMLVIEVDGEIHNQQLEYDLERTKIIESFGFKIIRFTNERVTKETDKVIAEIKSALEERPKNAPHFWKGNANDDLSAKIAPLPGRGAGGEANEISIEVFTTRPDTIFGATYLTLAPEHELVSQITTPENKKAVDEYVTWASNRSERERQSDVKKITGVFTGSYAEHPFTKKPIPVWVGDYVLAGYGTGAVMAVPAHDTRDFAFAKHFGLPIVRVIEPNIDWDFEKESYDEKTGKAINSDFLNGLEVKAAIKRAIEEIEKQNIGKGKINFRLRDAIFGRQRYWGEPIPIYYKDNIPYTLPESALPLVLPEVDKYLPTETGEPPLARAKGWTYSPLQGRGAGGEAYPLETTTMPGWAGSSWYFLRYMDPHNENAFANKEATDYWQNVDLYLGGSEHATGHLLYVRFWTKFLKDLGYINVDEPAKKLINQGMIQGVSEKIAAVGIDLEYQHKFENRNVEIPVMGNGYFEIPFSYDLINPKNRGVASVTRFYFTPKDPIMIDHFDVVYLSNTIEVNVPIQFVENNVLDIKGLLSSEFGKDYLYSFFLCHDGYWFNGEFTPYNNGNSDKFYTKSEVEKMSKSKYNVVNPDDMCNKFGADCFRMYEMFLGPLEQSKPWNTNGITGVSGFLKKLWRLFENASSLSFGEGRGEGTNSPLPTRGVGVEVTKAELKVIHKTIKKITEDIERFSFNTSVSSFMICVNELTDLKCTSRDVLQPLAILLSPYAPHIAEELWTLLGNAPSVTKAEWPIYDEQYLVEDEYEYPVSINGKKRFTISLSLQLKNDEIQNEVLSADKMKELLNGASPKKVIIIPGKIVNVVV